VRGLKLEAQVAEDPMDTAPYSGIQQRRNTGMAPAGAQPHRM